MVNMPKKLFLTVCFAAFHALACEVDFSIPEEKFPFVDSWLGQFSDELGEAVIFGGKPKFTYLEKGDAKIGTKHSDAWELYRTAAKFCQANSAFLSEGRKLEDSGKLEAYGWRVHRMNGLANLEAHPRIHHAVWQDKNGRKALFLANVSWADTDWKWNGHGKSFAERMPRRSYAVFPLWEVPDHVDAIDRAGGAKAIKSKPFSDGGAVYPNAVWRFDRADWSAYDRLVIDVVANGLGGDKLQLYIKDSWTKNSQDDWILDTFTPGSFGVYRWVVPMAGGRRTSCVLSSIKELYIFAGKPENPDYVFPSVRLVRRGAKLPPEFPVPEDVAIGRRKYNAQRSKARLRSMEGMLQAGDMRIGVASAMDKIRPDRPLPKKLPLTKGEKATLSLARNEYEALQVIVGNAGRETLEDVRVSVSRLANDKGEEFSSSNVTVAVSGYVKTRGIPRYLVGYNVPTNNPAGYVRLARKADPGWYPDPILDFLDCAKVRPTVVQGFWITLKCPCVQKSGVYRGKISVEAKNSPSAQIPFEVKVRDFTLPRTSPLPMAVSFWPGSDSPCRKLVDKRIDEWTDFLADHFITVDSLYLAGRPRWEQLLRLKSQGRLNRFQLSMWSDFKRSAEAEKDWMTNVNAGKIRLDAAYAKAKELGLLPHAYIYGMDEQPTNRFPAMKATLPHLKKWYPSVPIMSTCFDYAYGEDGMLSEMDVFIPDTTKYDFAKAQLARANGRKVWWYLACVPHAPYANFFVECEGIEPRSLMGVQAIKYRPDGFLYYATAIWRKNKPVEKGPFTDWDPFSWGGPGNEYNGDGSWTIPGPDGKPLETVRLFNFRDGLEDYAYAKIVYGRTGKWPEIPVSIVESVTNYNSSAEIHLRWREELANKVELVAKEGN